MAGRSDRQRYRLRRRLVPVSVGRSPKRPDRSGTTTAALPETTSPSGQTDEDPFRSTLQRSGIMARLDPRSSGQRRPPCHRIGHVDHGEGEVAPVGLQCFDAAGAGRLDRARFRRTGRQFLEQHQLPPADDALGVVGIGADDAAGAALVVGDRTVGEGVVGFLAVAVPLHQQKQGFVVGALVVVHRGFRARPDLIPDLPPHGRGRLTQRPGVLAAQDRPVGVVVQVDQVVAPPDEHRLPRGQQDTHAGLETARPVLGRAERRRGPVDRPHERSGFASTREQLRAERISLPS